MPAIVIVLMASGADAGRIPEARSPMCRSRPFIGGPAFAICADSTILTVAASGFIASATPRSRMSGATTSPRQPPCADRYASPAPQPDAGRVDRFLPERPESLALERGVAVPHVAAREKRLEPVVGRARQRHPAQDLAAFVRGERRLDRGAPKKTVTRVDELVDRGGPASLRRHGGSGLGKIGRR